MSLTPKQERFALEYVVDHNAAAAAVRAGYNRKGAKQIGYRNVNNPAVAQRIKELDEEQQEALGIDRERLIAMVVELNRDASVLQPKIWKGEPVTWVNPATGETEMVMEIRSPAAATATLEQLAKRLGLAVERSEVEVAGEVVFMLTLDRDLSEEEGE